MTGHTRIGTAAGAFLLGLVRPFVLFLVAVFVFEDIGGPLFWPILVLFGLFRGTALGFLFLLVLFLLTRLVRRRMKIAQEQR